MVIMIKNNEYINLPDMIQFTVDENINLEYYPELHQACLQEKIKTIKKIIKVVIIYFGFAGSCSIFSLILLTVTSTVLTSLKYSYLQQRTTRNA